MASIQRSYLEEIEAGASAEINAREAMLRGDRDAEYRWLDVAEAHYRASWELTP